MIASKEPYRLDSRPCLRLSEIYKDCPDLKLRNEKLATRYAQLAREREKEWAELMNRNNPLREIESDNEDK